MRILVLLAVAAQLADLLTMDPANELNPIGQHPLGPAAKVALIVALAAGEWAVGRRWAPVLAAAAVVGAVGVWSNLL